MLKNLIALREAKNWEEAICICPSIKCQWDACDKRMGFFKGIFVKLFCDYEWNIYLESTKHDDTLELEMYLGSRKMNMLP